MRISALQMANILGTVGSAERVQRAELGSTRPIQVSSLVHLISLISHLMSLRSTLKGRLRPPLLLGWYPSNQVELDMALDKCITRAQHLQDSLGHCRIMQHRLPHHDVRHKVLSQCLTLSCSSAAELSSKSMNISRPQCGQ